jgi:hypothetical protein
MADDGDPTLTDDGRWIVVDGRRWRASDPSIPAQFRTDLVDELMAARRSVGAARRNPDPVAEKAARRRVHLAKLALGERGRPWWEPETEDDRDERLEATVLTLAAHRAPDRTICPSDVARTAGGTDWRSLMEPVREVVRDLARAGRVEVTQKGQVLDPSSTWKGPIRIRATGTAAADGPG